MITVKTDWLLRGITCTKSGGHEALSGTVGWAVMKKICVLIKDRQQLVGRFFCVVVVFSVSVRLIFT